MSSYSKHPDDVALEALIDAAALELVFARTRAERTAAWESLKRLHAKRSAREVQAREARILCAGP